MRTHPVQPPQLSAEEIRAGEIEAAFTIKLALAGALSLYICKSPCVLGYSISVDRVIARMLM
jgi:hypothetical protein